ncbi:MAG TPA: hypothetical protein VGS21_00450 [Acidimicrobiales bacterium]|nr:hypothetical protein [Acidimicrobiales bacterium]
MARTSSDEVRIPRYAREAVARHETVVVFNRERAVLALVHPDDADLALVPRGRPLSNLVEALRALPSPDSSFGDDMEELVSLQGTAPEDPWARS